MEEYKYKVIIEGTIKANSRQEVEEELSYGFDGWDDIEEIKIEVYK